MVAPFIFLTCYSFKKIIFHSPFWHFFLRVFMLSGSCLLFDLFYPKPTCYSGYESFKERTERRKSWGKEEHSSGNGRDPEPPPPPRRRFVFGLLNSFYILLYVASFFVFLEPLHHTFTFENEGKSLLVEWHGACVEYKSPKITQKQKKLYIIQHAPSKLRTQGHFASF